MTLDAIDQKSGEAIECACTIRIGPSRRITLPKYLQYKFPLYFVTLVSIREAGEPVLAICDETVLAQLHQEFADRLVILSKQKSFRPTIPKTACSEFNLEARDFIWLVGNGSYFQVWSDKAWQSALNESFEHISPDDWLKPAIAA